MLIQPEKGSDNLCEMEHLSRPTLGESCGGSTRVGGGIRHPYRGFSTCTHQTFSARFSGLSGVNQSSQTARELFSYGMKTALRRAFSAQVGMLFGRWRQQARLFTALEMLAQNTSVTEVAIAVGYDSMSAFIEMFRTVLGTTPQTCFRTKQPPGSR
jgi:hypothetical protein